MKVIKDSKRGCSKKGAVVTIGNFDGLHLGHEKVIRAVTKRAATLGLISVVLTFDPHPRKVIGSGKDAPKMLLSLDDKVRLIEGQGVDCLMLLKFTKAFAAKHPRDFVEDVLVGRLNAREVWVGRDYSFGKGRIGTVEYLKELGREFSFKVRVVPALRKRGKIVSSSVVRELVEKGDVKAAAALLGRHYEITGKVVRGDSRGALLGFPTANMQSRNELIPLSGVYAGYVKTRGSAYVAAINVGGAPTFGRGRTVIEAHLIGFKGSLYGKNIGVSFVERLRPEKRFSSKAALLMQIEADVERTRKIIKKEMGLG
ncbi:MAG: bifunctional riboflavin kinase/FAD synthetase [Deltaproteobacteria bacterium]|nr:bifunctional riboflavin kinase/FAD synthetase [Deltaproteobacteria bacterium]